MEPVKLGLIGLGGMGRQHLEREMGLEEVRFTAIADSRRDVTDELAAKYGVAGYYSAEDLIASGRCEAVLIATPHPFHPTIAQSAAAAGLHVLTEKPLAVTVSEGDAMLAASRARPASSSASCSRRERSRSTRRPRSCSTPARSAASTARRSSRATGTDRRPTTTAEAGAAPGPARAAASS